MSRPTWLAPWSVPAVRDALAEVALGIAADQIELDPEVDFVDPLWATGRALIDHEFVAKFALSGPATDRLRHEARVLEGLGARPGLRVPQVVAVSVERAFFVTRLVAGEPLSYQLVAAALPSRVDEIAGELVSFLSLLHARDTVVLLGDAILGAPTPSPQATTDELRARLAPWIGPERVALVHRWCEWVDDVLASRGEPVFVHGDLHGHNQVWDHRNLRLRLVADFEESGIAEREYDLRYVPALGPGTDLLTATLDHYAHSTGRSLNPARVMAWHVRTVLGDALWRSEAGVALPGGGTPKDYVDGIERRFAALDMNV